MKERYNATTQNRFCPDMSNVNKNITVEAKLISPPTYEASDPRKLYSSVIFHSVLYTVSRPEGVFCWDMAPYKIRDARFQIHIMFCCDVPTVTSKFRTGKLFL